MQRWAAQLSIDPIRAVPPIGHREALEANWYRATVGEPLERIEPLD